MSGRAFITGVTGQDGSWLAEQLLAAGWQVWGLVRRSSSAEHWRIAHLDRLVRVSGDVTDLPSLLAALGSVKPTHVYNLAAQSSVADSFVQPIYTAQVVAMGAANLFEAARIACPNARIYQASSSEMFGASPAPQTEQTLFQPCSPYAAAKVYAHHLAVHYRRTYGMFIACGILFNHESDRRGPDFVTRHIARGVARIHAGHAATLPLGNLNARRDWGWAPDYTRAMLGLLTLDAPTDLVVATGVSHTVEEFAAAAFAVVGKDWRNHVVLDAARVRPCEVPDLLGDPSRAKSLLGWSPTLRFAQMVEQMVEAEIRRAAP